MKKGSTFMDYAIIISVVSIALFTMNIYVKRGLQGKVKDMSDFFISSGTPAQVIETDPEVTTDINTTASSQSTFNDKMLTAGAKESTFSDTTTMTMSSESIDRGKIFINPDNEPLVSAESGAVVNPPTTGTPEDNQPRQPRRRRR